MKQLYYTIIDKILNCCNRIRHVAAAAIALVVCALPPQAIALDSATYAAESKLARGNWVKVSVDQTGMHLLSESNLRSWGLDPSKTKVYGYGGRRLPEILDATYIDDLPQTPSEYVAGKGVFFYGEGTLTLTYRNGGYATPVQNPFTDLGYYFLTDGGSDPRLLPGESGSPLDSSDSPSTFTDYVVHEVDQISPGECGFLLVGEDFRFKPAQTFQMKLTNPVEGQPAFMEVSFVGFTATAGGRIGLSVNGTQLPSSNSDTFTAVNDVYTYGREVLSRKQVDFKGSNFNVEVRFSASGSVKAANLNYISVGYTREVKLSSSKNLKFMRQQNSTVLGGASAKTRVWDVTEPLNASSVRVAFSGANASWTSSYGNTRRQYVAWEPSGVFPQPKFVESVANQNLHGKKVPDMVIFTPAQWRTEAERLAQIHRTDPVEPLEVMVLTPGQVYNEFSSGSPDAQAYRKFLKMMYDRSQNGASASGSLRYALFFSRVTYDPRLKTDAVRALGYPMLPAWFTDSGLNENDSFTTDDIFGFLEDGSGVNIARDKLSIAVGRIPAVSLAEAKAAVDKISYYQNRMPKGNWKNNMLILADDQDNGDHMTQANTLATSMENSDSGNDVFFRKVYIDEYELIANQYPDAKAQLFRYLDEGVAVWAFLGHGSPSSLTHEMVVSYMDLNSMDLRHWPLIYAATCDFLRWDSVVRSGAEIIFNNPNGGVIGAISAVRPAYISLNGELTASFGRNFLTRDDRGIILPMGEGYRLTKNNYLNSLGVPVANENKLRYVLLGDPAMRLTIPSMRIVVDEIAGQPVTPLDGDSEPATLMARQQTTIKGSIVDPATGGILSGFNGTLNAILYDAEESVTTRGNGEKGEPVTFDRQGTRLFVGTAKVVNGRFTLNVSMPAEVRDNYRRAAFNLYAYGTNGGNAAEAASVCRDFYVYGEDESARPDNIPPVIESIYLNHPSFESGQQVNANPVLLATISDNVGINLSQAGVGHSMTISLDEGDRTYADVADYFTPFADGRPGGNIAYPLTNLQEGYHAITLRVWDNQPNSTAASVECFVVNDIAPTLYDVYTETNPVQDMAKFYVTHDRPDRSVTVTIDVYDLMGRRLWSTTETGRSEMFTSMAITWDLVDSGGRRVPRGIYVYRATITDTDSGEKSSTASKKLAVKGI